VEVCVRQPLIFCCRSIFNLQYAGGFCNRSFSIWSIATFPMRKVKREIGDRVLITSRCSAVFFPVLVLSRVDHTRWLGSDCEVKQHDRVDHSWVVVSTLLGSPPFYYFDL
jgi:hypothetical protein